MRIWPATVLAGITIALASGSGQRATIVKPLTQGPVTYFANQCSRCHGPSGSNYVLDSLRKRTSVSLKHEISEMASGPGQMPLKGRDLDAQVALHEAIMKGIPFLSLTKVSGTSISGEVVGTNKVLLRQGARVISARVVDATWTASIPASWLPINQPIWVIAGLKKQAVMDLSKNPASVGLVKDLKPPR